MSKRKFVVDIPTELNELLQQNVPMNDVKSYIRQKINEGSFFDELVGHYESNSEKKNAISNPTTIAASSVKSVDEALSLVGIKYRSSLMDYMWRLAETPDKTTKIKYFCKWLGRFCGTASITILTI
ncbi:hypothetical protein MMC31_006071 [Peltigera leucophlebia]|nr:hypothetical protein [Peltigera leucophlebia]